MPPVAWKVTSVSYASLPNWFGPATFWNAGSMEAKRFVLASTSVPPRCAVAAAPAPTQTAALPAATVVGCPRVRIVAATRFERASMRVSVPAY